MISVPQLFCERQRDWQRKETVPAFINLFIETGAPAVLYSKQGQEKQLISRYRLTLTYL
jgi:hypothetical protein